jgi:hypothetical protein
MLGDKLNIYEAWKLILVKTLANFSLEVSGHSRINHVNHGKNISSTRWSGLRLNLMPAVDIVQKKRASFTSHELNSDS